MPASLRPGRDLTVRRSPWWAEVALIVWLSWVYDMIANLAPFREGEALRDGASILHLEVVTHLDPERAMDAWLRLHPLLGVITGDYYDNAHFIVTFGVIGWLWWTRPDVYRPMRNALVLANLLGFVVFLLYPVAPPRLLPHAHIADIVSLTHAIGGWHSGTLGREANQFASMPSLHLAWAAWAAWAAWRALRGRRLAWLVWVYPVLTGLAVMATGNHYLLDVVAGVATLVVSVLAADALQRQLLRRRTLPSPPTSTVGASRPDAGRPVSARTGVVATPAAGHNATRTNAQP